MDLKMYFFLFFLTYSYAGLGSEKDLVVGAQRMEEYLPLLVGKRVGIVANHSSRVEKVHLVDTLLSLRVNIIKIFSPEHGFRGNQGAGEKISNQIDSQTKLPIISLYGKHYKPSVKDMEDLDIIIFDIQDVGVRFYTYISTLFYVMEACAEQGKGCIVLDRPNPNRHYIDGPVLEKKFTSFVGILPVPVVYGMTIGELAKMIQGEKWLQAGVRGKLWVIALKNYHKNTEYTIPSPSPNLPNAVSIALYPSLCFFEPTVVSVGRGTVFPFQVLGYPSKDMGAFHFMPVSVKGAAPSPKWEEKKCYGMDLRDKNPKNIDQIDLDILMYFYKKIHGKGMEFFKNKRFFSLLAGTAKLLKMIETGKTIEEIKQSWKEDIEIFKEKREKYLIYDDFIF